MLNCHSDWWRERLLERALSEAGLGVDIFCLSKVQIVVSLVSAMAVCQPWEVRRVTLIVLSVNSVTSAGILP